MDSRIGLDYIVENAEYTTKLGAGKWHKDKILLQIIGAKHSEQNLSEKRKIWKFEWA